MPTNWYCAGAHRTEISLERALLQTLKAEIIHFNTSAPLGQQWRSIVSLLTTQINLGRRSSPSTLDSYAASTDKRNANTAIWQAMCSLGLELSLQCGFLSPEGPNSLQLAICGKGFGVSVDTCRACNYLMQYTCMVVPWR